jgi:hypothetical protein
MNKIDCKEKMKNIKYRMRSESLSLKNWLIVNKLKI